MSRVAFKCNKCGWETELIGEKHHCAMSETPKAPRIFWVDDGTTHHDANHNRYSAYDGQENEYCVKVIEFDAYLELARENERLGEHRKYFADKVNELQNKLTVAREALEMLIEDGFDSYESRLNARECLKKINE